MKRIPQKEVLQYCIENHLAFAIYKYPNEQDICLLISKEARSKTVEDVAKVQSSAYVIAPFASAEHPTVFLSDDFVVYDALDESQFEGIKHLQGHESTNTGDANFVATYSDYQKQFEQLKANIESGDVDKAILSRVKLNTELQKSQASEFFYQLVQSYPAAYVFMYYTPQSGLWAGASPELLLSISNGKATTVSLAGTRNGQDNAVSWGDKELEEQQIVTDFVGELLHREGIDNYTKEGPITVNAGKMVHLKTTYIFDSSVLKGRLCYFIHQLYPTPAVCGLPKQAAMQTILQIEQHERSYYAGFVGRIEEDTVRLYVNIRSLKFVSEGVHLYLGGGITAGSEVQMEWNETELKAQTMLNVIEKCH